MAFKFNPGSELRENGIKVLDDVPFIVSDAMSYYSIENRFLRQAKIGHWKVGASADDGPRSALRKVAASGVSASTIKTYADDLTNFLGWCEEHNRYTSVVDIDEDGLDEYADDMQHGVWSQDGTELSKGTICRRLSTVIACTEFAIAMDLRAPYEFTMVERSYQYSTGENSHAGETRHGSSYAVVKKRRGDPRKMILPSKKEIRKFASSFDDLGKEIGVGLILFCGLRITEVENIKDAAVLTIRQVENKYGHANQEVPVRVIGKGDKERTIYMPPHLLELIEEYRNTDRKRLLGRSPTGAAKAALLLNNYGDPLTVSALRKAWNSAREAMVNNDYDMAHFSPHIGRHAFAVYWLVDQIKADAKQVKQLPADMPKSQVRGMGEAHILDLQNMLGHSQYATTEKYLVMLPHHWRVEVNMNRQMYLDDGDDSG